MKNKKDQKKAESKKPKNKSRIQLGKIVKVPIEKVEDIVVYARCEESTYGCAYINSYTTSEF